MAATQSAARTAAGRFHDLAAAIGMEQAMETQCWDLLQKVSPLVQMSIEDEPFWFACSIIAAMMTAKAEKKAEFRGSPSLDTILKFTGVRLADVFEPMQTYLELSGISGAEGIRKEIDELGRRFILMSLFTKKYKDMFSSSFTTPLITGVASDYTLGWALFLAGSHHILPSVTDLVQLLNVLICSVNFIYVLSDDAVRKRPIPSGAGTEDERSLKQLAALYSANAADVQAMYTEKFLPFIHEMCHNGDLYTSIDGKYNITSAPAHTQAFEGFIGDEVVSKNVKRLHDMYGRRHAVSFMFDERLFLEATRAIGTPSKMPSKMKQYYNYSASSQKAGLPKPALCFDTPGASPTQRPKPKSPVTPRTIRVTVPATPVTTSMQTLHWLNKLVANQEDGPTSKLTEYLEVAKMGDAITKRVEELSAKVDFRDADAKPSRRALACRLYYRLLEAMLVAEEQRLKTKDFKVLLSQEMFHRSLIACCLEITAYCFKADHLAYPLIPEALGIEPFEYHKIIENVVRHECTIPLVLKRHLMYIEELILQEDAWKSGSSLFTLLLRPGQQQVIYKQVAANEDRGETRTAVTVTPNRLRRRSTLHSPAPAKAGAGSRTPGGSLPRSRSLELFFKKVLSLANARMQQLFKHLQVPRSVYHNLWFSFVHELVWHPDIIKDRHLDQVIMCTLYGVCRANKLEAVTFRRILDGYRSQPQATSELWRSVLLEDGTRGDIIKFYNEVFVTKLEAVLWKYHDVVPKSATMAPLGSPMKVAPKYNLYLSPFKGGSATPRTPGTTPIRYDIGKSPAKDLARLNVAAGTKRKASRRLDFGNVDGEGAAKKRKLNEDAGEGSSSPRLRRKAVATTPERRQPVSRVK